MSRFLDSISTIITVFHQHAKEDGVSSTLSRRKMKEFIQKEFADVLAKPHDPQTIDKILQFLEWDGDGEIDFNEFLLLVFRVAKACYWYLPQAPYLLQRTKLTTGGKSLPEPETKSRGSRRQLREEEQEPCERNHPPPREQRESRLSELERLEETVRDEQQRNQGSRTDAKRRSEQIPQGYGERRQEPSEQRSSQRRRQALEADGEEEVELTRRGRGQAREREDQERSEQEQVADVRVRWEAEALPNRWSRRRPEEAAGAERDQSNQRPREADRGRDNQPRRPESLREERSRYRQ
ncbi:PREDICTED: trichohyalin-like, partial [Acanthisitta chloris]|uniref:trichohyalin-like n=1 Tax=Acanthisitta chloris TaxID=57068 RepID=UPI0004F0F094